MYIHVTVTPGAKEAHFKQLSPAHFICNVREIKEHNLANKAVFRLLISHFKTNDIRLVNGHRSRKKIFVVGD